MLKQQCTVPNVPHPGIGAAVTGNPQLFLLGFGSGKDPVKEKVAGILARVGERRAEMLQDFSTAAPDLGNLSHHKLSNAIDVHENFDDPKSLHVTVKDGVLKLFHSATGGSWHVNLTTYASLPAGQ